MDGWIEMKFLGMACLFFQFSRMLRLEKSRICTIFGVLGGTKKRNSAFSTRTPSKPLIITSHDVNVDLNAVNAKKYRINSDFSSVQ